MIRAGVGQSSDVSTARAAAAAIEQAFAQAGTSHADAALVFFSAEHGAPASELAETIRRLAGTDQIAGCSAAGVLTANGEVEGDHGVAVMVFRQRSVFCPAVYLRTIAR